MPAIDGNNIGGVRANFLNRAMSSQTPSSSTAKPITPGEGSWFSRSSIMNTDGVLAFAGVALVAMGATPMGWGIAGAAVLAGVAYASSQKDGAKLEDLKDFAKGFIIPPLILFAAGCCFLYGLESGMDISNILSGSSAGEEKKEEEEKRVR